MNNRTSTIKGYARKAALAAALQLVIPVSGILTSCVDLGQTSLSDIDKDNFYQTESDLQVALNGVYQILTDREIAGEMHGIYNNQLIYFNDLQSEYARRGKANSADIAEIANFAITPTNSFVESTWLVHYTGINRANILIDKAMANTSTDATVRQNIIRQAKFLRALYYFNLVRYYGDVPLALHDGEAEGEPRAPQDKVYEQIVADLKEAEQIPVGFSPLSSVVSGDAATGLLSKVYLQWAQADTEYATANQQTLYKNAVDAADKVITSGRHKLNEKFCDNWSQDKKDNPELLFTAEHLFGVNRNVTGHCVFSTGFVNGANNYPVITAVDNSVRNTFEATDQRRDATVIEHLWNPYKQEDFKFERVRFRKYIDTLYMANYANAYESGQNTSSSVLRYAEILLVKAEAENELNGPANAYAAINEVRRRAYYDPWNHRYNTPTDGTSIELSGLTKEQFRKALQQERYREFMLEGTRWFDLKRWHILVKTIKNNVSRDDEYGAIKYKNVSYRHYFLPIPTDQIALNPKLTQNWGYNGESGISIYEEKGWE